MESAHGGVVVSTEALELPEPQPRRTKRAWDRQKGETQEAFHAFVHYRDLGPTHRSIAAALASHEDGCTTGRQRGKSGAPLSRWEAWSSKHRWVERARLFDDEMDGRRQEAYAANVISMAERHATLAERHMELLAAPAIAAVAALKANPDAIQHLAAEAAVDPRALMSLLRFVEETTKVMPGLAKMEREARGVRGPALDKASGETAEVRIVIEYADPEDWQG